MAVQEGTDLGTVGFTSVMLSTIPPYVAVGQAVPGMRSVQEAYREIQAGAILQDASLAQAARSEWFEADWWRAQGRLTGEASGRGRVLFMQAPAGCGEGEWVLRRFERGGLVRTLVRRHYLWMGEDRNRGFAEWRLLARLYEAGLPVPRPVAARYRRTGLGRYVAELITHRLPDNRTLRELYTDDEVPPDVWGRVGEVIRRMHDAGAFHPDLNAGNVLVTAAHEIYIIDFDQARLRPPGRWRARNLARLKRSLQKTAVQGGRDALLPSHWQALLAGYGEHG